MTGKVNLINDNIKINIKEYPYSFKKDQILTGKIIKKDDYSNNAIIKLNNGAELTVEIKGDKGLPLNKLINFKVDNIIDGKLQLKAEIETNNSLNKIDFYNALKTASKEDKLIYNAMLNNNIPLTKENIKEIKSILTFLNKIQLNPKEIEVFIEKYINSRNIQVNTAEGKNINKLLNNFFDSFKNLSMEEILYFKSASIPLTKENIDTYNKIVKVNHDIFNISRELNNKIDKEISKNNLQEDSNFKIKDNKSRSENTKNDFNINKSNYSKENNIKDTTHLNTNSKLTEDMKVSTNNKEHFSNQIRETQINEETNIRKNEVDNFIKESKVQSTDNNKEKNIQNEIITILKNHKLQGEEGKFELLAKILKNIPIKNLTSKTIVNTFDFVTGGKIQLSNNELSKIFKAITNVSIEEIGEYFIKEKELPIKAFENNAFDLKNIIKNKENNQKEIAKSIIEKLNNGNFDEAKIATIVKNSINELKTLNKISEDFYFLNLPVKLNNEEYQCKLIIKDERKEGKTLDKENAKIALNIKTKNFGDVDSYITINNKFLNLEIQCEKKFVDLAIKNVKELKNKISEIGFNPKISVKEKLSDFSVESYKNYFAENNIYSINVKV